QAPRQWNANLTSALIECGFVQSKSDYSFFTKKFGDVFIALLVYVDDIIIAGNNLNEINKFKQFLKAKFMIKDLGKLKYFLGIEVLETPTGVCLSQRKYYLELIDEFRLLASKPSYIPMQTDISLSSEPKDDDPLLDNITHYKKLIGKLRHLTTTRPDIAYTVSCLSQFMHNPLKSHLKTALKVIRPKTVSSQLIFTDALRGSKHLPSSVTDIRQGNVLLRISPLNRKHKPDASFRFASTGIFTDTRYRFALLSIFDAKLWHIMRNESFDPSPSLSVVLCNIQVFAKVMPSLFAPNFEDFFISSSDAYQVKALKLEILSFIATDVSISVIFQEFQDYVRDPDRRFAADTVAAIGLCAKRNPQVANTCLEGLLALTSPKSINSASGSMDDDAVLIQAITSIKDIIKQDPPTHDKAIIFLARNLEAIKVPVARAMIVWIVGEYNSVGNIIPKMVPIILRFLARGFPSESIETKHQILNAAVKVVLGSKGEDFHTARTILNYVLELAKFDSYYDVRDRARVLRKLLSCYLSSSGLEEEASKKTENYELQILLAEHLFGETVTSSTEMVNNRFYLPGSLSQIVLHAAPGYEPLPEPCSLTVSDMVEEVEGPTQADSYEVDNSDVESGSLNEEGSYDSEESVTDLTGTDYTNGSAASEADNNTDPLINLSDVGKSQKDVKATEKNEYGELMSKGALESWLDENPMYTYSSKASTISPSFVSVDTSFENCSSEPLSKLYLSDEDSAVSSESSDQSSPPDESSLQSQKDAPILAPMEEIATLEPGQTTKAVIHVRFHHHLLPVKLILWCDGKKHPVKLRPDIGYFIKPLPMDVDVFSHKESQLPGMFEYTRR
nr:AP-3 complex subunit beta-A [Tanacetum cinerariifolium]